MIPDRVAAIHRALGVAGPGDCVLIAGKGHETYQIIGDQRLPLDDREVARSGSTGSRPVTSVSRSGGKSI